MIVVVGQPYYRETDDGAAADGMAARVAMAAASADTEVQLVGRTGDDPTADGLLSSLARGGVGHVAVLRDPSRLTPLLAERAPDDGDAASSDDAGPAASVDVATPTLEPPRPSPLDAADVELGLRYLTDFAVVVLAEPAGPDVVRVVADAARWNGAQLVMVLDAGIELPDGLPPDAIVFEAPADDREGDFAALVGRFAAALDDGTDAADAFRATISAEGWTEAAPD